MITIGVDLGGTNLRAAAFDAGGSMLSVHKERLGSNSPEAVFRSVLQKVEESARDAGVSLESISALCVALAGQVHRSTGIVALGPNLGWADVPFGSMLEEAFPFPVRLVNDLSAAAWGEREAGAGEGADAMALVAVGSGVGAGIIDGGRLVDGSGGLAGEIGHTKVVPGGEPCGCGELGCLEAYTGGHRMAARALRMWPESGRPKDASRVTMRTIMERFEAEDEVARQVLKEAGDHLGLAVANLVTLLNPNRLILGGGVLLGVPYLAGRVREAVSELTSAPARGQVSIELAALGDDAGLVGAGHLAREAAGLE